MLIEYLLIAGGVLSIITVIVVTKMITTTKRKVRCINQFTEYQSILEYFMEKAFDIVYKDQIFTYSLEGTKPREAAIDAMSQDFVRLTQKFLGPMMLDELIFMYGGEKSFTFNLLNYFSNRYENDEIRSSTLAQLKEGGDEEI